MKTYTKTRGSKGFTLIELLVVITIIAVLAAMSFAGVQLALRKAKKTESLTMATNLAQAVEQFYSEYNRLPDLQSQFETDAGGDGQRLLEILLGQENPGGDMENSRSIVFLNSKEAKGRKGGVYYGGGNTVQAMYDSFGNPFQIFLNTEYDDELSFSVGGRQYRLRGKQVAVYSPGGDMEEGNSDDIKTF